MTRLVCFEKSLLALLVMATVALAEDAPAPKPAPAPAPKPEIPAPKVKAPAPQLTEGDAKAEAPKADAKNDMPADVRDMTNPMYLVDLAQAHISYGAYERAAPLLQKAMENAKAPDQKVRISQLRGYMFQRQGDWKSAVTEYETMLPICTNEAMRTRFTILLADANLNLNEGGKAEKLLLEALQAVAARNSADEGWLKQEIFSKLVQTWLKQPNRIETVVSESEADLKKNPADEMALVRLSELYKAGKYEPVKAVSVIEKLAELHPTDASMPSQLAGLYQAAQKYDKAAEVYKTLMAKAVNKDQGHQYAQQVVSMMLKSGQKAEALAFAKEHFITDASTSADILTLVALFDQNGASAEGEPLVSLAASKAKTPEEKCELLLRLADNARARKEFDKSEAQIRSVLKEYKDDKGIKARCVSALIRLYEQQGKIGELKLND